MHIFYIFPNSNLSWLNSWFTKGDDALFKWKFIALSTLFTIHSMFSHTLLMQNPYVAWGNLFMQFKNIREILHSHKSIHNLRAHSTTSSIKLLTRFIRNYHTLSADYVQFIFDQCYILQVNVLLTKMLEIIFMGNVFNLQRWFSLKKFKTLTPV